MMMHFALGIGRDRHDREHRLVSAEDPRSQTRGQFPNDRTLRIVNVVKLVTLAHVLSPRLPAGSTIGRNARLLFQKPDLATECRLGNFQPIRGPASRQYLLRNLRTPFVTCLIERRAGHFQS
jgi:hypothetical protein